VATEARERAVERGEVPPDDVAVDHSGAHVPNFPERRRAAAARSILASCGT
jgi:hypothetical protein